MVSMEIFLKTFSVARALLTGTVVSRDQMRKRLEVCAKCDKVEVQGMLMRCGICGCQVAEQGLINLARYEETDLYGCKHEDGSKWKAAGV